MVITELLERNARLYGSDIALVEINPSEERDKAVTWREASLIEQALPDAPYRRELSWKDFDRRANRFANLLLSRSLERGTKVGILLMNCLEWLPIYFGILKAGCVAVPLNFRYSSDEIKYCLELADVEVLVFGPEFVGRLDPIADQLSQVKQMFFVGRNKPAYAEDCCKLMGYCSSSAPPVALEETDYAAIYFSSGTTGFPKGVMLTHHNIVNNGKNIGDRMDLSTADRMMIQVPMFHCFGMVLAMTASMTHGTTILPLPYFSPKPALACINNERITAFHGVPTMFIALLEHEDFPKTDFSYMRTGIMAGSPCPIAVMQDVVNKMHMDQITIVYGQTEAAPGCTMSSTDDSLEVRVNTVGRPLPEIECKIVDPETGEDLPDNVDGEFVARGYNIMKGYYKMPGATAAAIDKDGWLHTGDLARRDENGNFKITGRIKDMIIRGGENIYPKEIEDFIYTHPKVSDVQVIGVPDEQYGEEIMACVILKEGETMTEKEMKQYVLDHMAKHKVPRYVDFVDAFPMNAAGKILKYKMREDATRELGLDGAAGIDTAKTAEQIR